VAHRGAGRNRTDEWRFCSSRRALAGVYIDSESLTRVALSSSARHSRFATSCVLFGLNLPKIFP
jgi:hypothetical protein